MPVPYEFTPNTRIESAKVNANFEYEDNKESGWNKIDDTLVYNDPVTVAVPAGALLKYQVGDKYKVNQNVPLTTVYNFDANSNSQIGSYNGTDTAISYATAGKFGAGCATFTAASSSKIVIADNAVFKPTTAFTLGLWFKTGTTGTEKQLFQSYSQNSAVAGIRARITAANVLQIVIGKNTGTTVGTDYTTTTCTTNTICDGNWHYVVFSYQSNFIRIFLDGNSEYSGYTIQPAYAALNSNYIRIGSGSDAGSDAAGVFMNGSIDDLFFINGHAVDQYWVAAKYAQATAQGIANITPTYQGYITNVANTLLTVTGGADYVLYNSTLSSPYYSHANPVGFPDVFNVSLPTTGFSDSSTTIFKMKMNGREIHLWGAPSGASNTTTLSFTLPVASSTGAYGVCFVFDNAGWVTIPGEIQINIGSSTMTVYKQVSGGAAFTASGTKSTRLNISYPI